MPTVCVKAVLSLRTGERFFLMRLGTSLLRYSLNYSGAVQEGVFERLGGEKEIRCDVRIVAASHIDLESAIRGKLFREDLYYRIGVFSDSSPSAQAAGRGCSDAC